MSEREQTEQPNDGEQAPGSAALPDGKLPSGETPVCGNCGAAIRVDDIVCPTCGIELVSG